MCLICIFFFKIVAKFIEFVKKFIDNYTVLINNKFTFLTSKCSVSITSYYQMLNILHNSILMKYKIMKDFDFYINFAHKLFFDNNIRKYIHLFLLYLKSERC